MPSRPWPRRLGAALASPRGLGLVLMCAATALAGCGGSSSPSRPLSHTRTGPPLRTIFTFGGGGQLLSDPVGTLDALRALGVGMVKLYLPWNALAPNADAKRAPTRFSAADPAAYPAADWIAYDDVIRAAHARGIAVDLTIGGAAPDWATVPGSPGGPAYQGVWKPSATAFGAFVHAVATRYSGTYTPPGQTGPLPRVSFWAIWNEPNYGQYLAPQAIDDSTVEVGPALYRALLDAAWRAFEATGHGPGTDTILIGELAPRGLTVGNVPGNFGGMVPLRFVRALYCVGSTLRPLQGRAAALRGCPTTAAGARAFPGQHPALFQAGGVSVHPYPQGNIPPTQPTTFEPDYADFAALPNLERTLDSIDAAYHWSRHLLIYSTEYGYQTNPPEKIAHAAPVAAVAAYLNEAEYLSWLNPRIASYDQYLLVDPPGANSLGGFATGLEFADGAPKATMAAFRLPLYLPVSAGSKGQPLEVWGCVRPAVFLARPQSIAIEYGPGPRGPWQTVRRVAVDDAGGYFDVTARFPASGLVRLLWRSPTGQPFFSRLAPVSIR